MTYEELDLEVSRGLERLAYEGVEVEKMLLGPDARCALSQYPGPIVKVSKDDPDYGKREYRGIPWAPSQTLGITLIHAKKSRAIKTYGL